MEASVKRNARRASKDGVQLATKLELDTLVKSVNEAVQQLSQNQEKLGRNINQNLGAIQGAFVFTDAHLHIHRRVMTDMALGRLQMLVDEVGEPNSIDFDWYHRQYQNGRRVIAFFHWLKKFLGIGKKEEVVAPQEELQLDDFTFGGDYEGQNSSAG